MRFGFLFKMMHNRRMTKKLPHVVILGSGFAGLAAAQSLKNAPVQVTVVDEKNHHLFQPLLYQVATAGLNPADIASPVRAILRKQKNTQVFLDKAVKVDLKNQCVVLSETDLPYDYLIMATGATHSYFGHENWAQFAPGLKSLQDALLIREKIFLAYEQAEKETDPQKQKALLTFVVIGGGPTGVELAGSLAEISRFTLTHDFRRIHSENARIILIEGQEFILSSYPKKLSLKAKEQLEAMGVEVITKQYVKDITADRVVLSDRDIQTHTVLWAAGVKASPLAESLGVALDKNGRVIVDSMLRVPNHPHVFVAGDLMAFQQNNTWVPGVAPAAMQAGEYCASHIQDLLKGKTPKPFRYCDKGSMATVGRSAAVAKIGNFEFSGFLAWSAWLFIHILFLVGFKNRFSVLFQWGLSYLTYQRGARLITKEIKKKPPENQNRLQK